jgi:hypothetical protein
LGVSLVAELLETGIEQTLAPLGAALSRADASVEPRWLADRSHGGIVA